VSFLRRHLGSIVTHQGRLDERQHYALMVHRVGHPRLQQRIAAGCSVVVSPFAGIAVYWAILVLLARDRTARALICQNKSRVLACVGATRCGGTDVGNSDKPR
jgi:hypothetical protein